MKRKNFYLKIIHIKRKYIVLKQILYMIRYKNVQDNLIYTQQMLQKYVKVSIVQPVVIIYNIIMIQ